MEDLEEPMAIPEYLLDLILINDSPDMLDVSHHFIVLRCFN